jgi:hypothetical protein
VPTQSTPRTLAEALRAIEAGAPAQEAVRRMIEGCAVLGALVAQAYERRRLDADEARAIAYTLGIVGREPVLVDEVFVAAHASFKELDRLRRGLPSPMGCARLRRIGERDCACPVLEAAVPYATPALFALDEPVSATRKAPPFAPWLTPGEPPVASPLEQISDALRRLDSRLERLEARGGVRPAEETP